MAQASLETCYVAGSSLELLIFFPLPLEFRVTSVCHYARSSSLLISGHSIYFVVFFEIGSQDVAQDRQIQGPSASASEVLGVTGMCLHAWQCSAILWLSHCPFTHVDRPGRTMGEED